jgi:hypothetical protein
VTVGEVRSGRLSKTTFDLIHEWLHPSAADSRAQSAALKSILELLRMREVADVARDGQLARLESA